MSMLLGKRPSVWRRAGDVGFYVVLEKLSFCNLKVPLRK